VNERAQPAAQELEGGASQRVALTFRTARPEDLRALVEMLADDTLGSMRERIGTELPASYVEAFAAIAADPNNEIVVACMAERIVASLQITYTPSLSYQGSWRATLESVRTAADLRGRGIGTQLVRHAIELARARGCGLVQLSTNKVRTDARRFYEKLGFHATHEGMKIVLPRHDPQG
jgi:ribosomal protein S18 acetylase RimI-like enzyme